jgi:hypothetical protein
VAGATLGLDEPVTAQHGEVLGQMRSLQARFGLEVRDADLLSPCEQFEKTDAEGCASPLNRFALTS